MDVYDSIQPYRVEYEDGDYDWFEKSSLRELYKVGQRIEYKDGRLGEIDSVDEDDFGMTYRIELDDGFTYWVSPLDVTKRQADRVESPSTEVKMTVGIEGGESMKEITDKLNELDEQIETVSKAFSVMGATADELRNLIAESIVVESDKTKAPNQDRADIVRKAKEYIDDQLDFSGYYTLSAGNTTNAEYIVNEEKQTVVVLLRGFATGIVRAKGKAKASQGDVFNVHIGKAIALAKALSKDVPDEFINAPQPNKMEVGMVAKSKKFDDVYVLSQRATEYDGSKHGRAFYSDGTHFGWIGEKQIEIIDDSAINYEKGGK